MRIEKREKQLKSITLSTLFLVFAPFCHCKIKHIFHNKPYGLVFFATVQHAPHILMGEFNLQG